MNPIDTNLTVSYSKPIDAGHISLLSTTWQVVHLSDRSIKAFTFSVGVYFQVSYSAAGDFVYAGRTNVRGSLALELAKTWADVPLILQYLEDVFNEKEGRL